MKSAFFLLPGALFAAVVIITLTLNTTVLQAIPARLTPSGYTLEDYLAEMNAAAMEDDGAAAAETQKKAPEFGERKSNAKEPKPSAAGIGDYEDGVYIGSSSGYGGPIEVRVTVRGRQITDVEILSAPGETEEFFNRAMGVVACVLTAQTWEVDVISGATYSSRGILGAIQNALTGRTVENEPAPQPAPAAVSEPEPYTDTAAFQDGTYFGTAAGFGGEIRVAVVIRDGRITDIQILEASGETEPYFNNAKSVIGRILELQNPNVDTVSGATYSSGGIINAVKQALRQAAADPSPNPEEPDDPDNSDDPDKPADTTDPTKPEKPSRPEKDDPDDGNDPDPENGAKYKDGTYAASGWCFDESGTFRYEMTVAVKIRKGAIRKVSVSRGTDESRYPALNERFLEYAVNGREAGGVSYAGVPAQIVSLQTTAGVDVVSGATYSSRVIKSLARTALKEALTDENADDGEEEDDPSGPGGEEENKPGTEDKPGGDDNNKPGDDDDDNKPGGDDENKPGDDDNKPGGDETGSGYADGVFSAAGWVTDDQYGMFEYKIIVHVTVAEGLITGISLDFGEDRSVDPEENDYYIDMAVNGSGSGAGVPAQIKAKQTTDVDTVSGATYTSETLISLAAEALSQSKASAPQNGV